jgi:PPOX class probable F420-dependent enzyme
VLDESTEFGARAARRLREEIIAWLTTVSPQGSPQPVPVWFLWDGDRSLLLYSQPGKPKLRNIHANPRASLHLDSNGLGGNVVVCRGELGGSDDPPAHQVRDYITKYAARIDELGWTPENFAARYSVPLRLEIARITGW